jgi:thioredoxin 1
MFRFRTPIPLHSANSRVRFLLVAISAVLFWGLPLRAADRQIYPDPAQARTDLTAALHRAAATHRHVLLDFGGNWCGDCQVLDIYFHDAANQALLQQNYVLVRINVGQLDQNQPIAQRYGITLSNGVPALVVLDEHGRLLYSQRTAEFKTMRRMDVGSVTSFLLQWKPAKPGA